MASPLTVRNKRGQLGNYHETTLGVLLVDATGAAAASTLMVNVDDVTADELAGGDGYVRSTLDVIVDQDGETGQLKADPLGTPPVFDTTDRTPAGIWLYDTSGGSDATDELLVFLPVEAGPGFADWEPGWPDVLARWLLDGTVIEGEGGAPRGGVTVTAPGGVADVAAAFATTPHPAAVFVNGALGLTEVTMPDPTTTGAFLMVVVCPEDGWTMGTGVSFTGDSVLDWERDKFWFDTDSGIEGTFLLAAPWDADEWRFIPLPPQGVAGALTVPDWVSGGGGGAVDSVNGQTGTVVLDAADVGAQASHANLTALAGLSLVADKLAYANGTGTLALTDLTSFARTLLDDANAAAALSTLGAAAAVATGPSLVSGVRNYMVPGVAVTSTTGTIALGSNTIWYSPILVRTSITVDRLWCELTTVTNPSNIRLGIVAADADWQPVGGAAAIDATAAITTTGGVTATVSATLPPGKYLRCIVSDSANTVRAGVQLPSWGQEFSAGVLGGGANIIPGQRRESFTYGTLTGLPAWTTATLGQGAVTEPLILMRWT